MRRKYSSIDLLRFKKFADKNSDLKPIDLLKQFDKQYPELTERQKLINLYAALGMNDKYKELVGEDIPDSAKWEYAKTSDSIEITAMPDEPLNFKHLEDKKYQKMGNWFFKDGMNVNLISGTINAANNKGLNFQFVSEKKLTIMKFEEVENIIFSLLNW